MVYEGYEDHRIGMDLLGPYLHHVHLKNAAAFPDELRANGIQKWRNRWTPLDEGLVNVKDFLLALEAGGYNGWISLEDLSTERDPLSTLKYNAGVLNALGRPAGGTHRQLTDRIGEETRFGTSTAPLFHGFSGARAFR
ncbi:xylose isomerase domain protein TIM barrel [Arthrobacter sp. Hiyo8]|nr:xylose isomerase domain protein TIM barrel [Arthrobacter sp. Hiyo8]